jgi:hypothetical protein
LLPGREYPVRHVGRLHIRLGGFVVSLAGTGCLHSSIQAIHSIHDILVHLISHRLSVHQFHAISQSFSSCLVFLQPTLNNVLLAEFWMPCYRERVLSRIRYRILYTESMPPCCLPYSRSLLGGRSLEQIPTFLYPLLKTCEPVPCQVRSFSPKF